MLGTLRAFAHWLCQLHLDSVRGSGGGDSSSQQLLHSILTTIIQAATPLIKEGVPEKLLLSASHLLLSLASTVRPRHLGSLPPIRELMEKACAGKLTDIPKKVNCGGVLRISV